MTRQQGVREPAIAESIPRQVLSRDQVAFLRFAHSRPQPFAWWWLDADGAITVARVEHAFLAARKRVAGAEVQARITVAEFEGLKPYWKTPLVELNDAGLAAVADDGSEGSRVLPGPS